MRESGSLHFFAGRTCPSSNSNGFQQQSFGNRLIVGRSNTKMKIITATVVLGLVAISEAKKGGKLSTASTKAAKSLSYSYDTKSAKADSSLSYSAKSGKAKSSKADLSLSMSMSTSPTTCLPCSIGLPLYAVDCATDVGFCTYIGNPPTIEQCAANNCTPECSLLEPVCDSCSFGPILGVDCPDGDICEFQWSVDAAPTCKLSDCVPPSDDTIQCDLCSNAAPGANCPQPPANVDYCQVNIENGGTTCVACNETTCPDLPFSECEDPPAAGGTRKLEMSNEGHVFNELFQWWAD